MTDEERIPYEELQRRLADAEDAIEALRQHEVDVVIGDEEIAYVRLRQMEEKLQAKSHQIRDVLESIGDAFLAVDKQWRITYVNEQAAAMCAESPEDLVGHNLWDCLDRLPGGLLEELCVTAMDDEEAGHADLPLPEGRWISVSVYPSSAGLSIYWRDVTESKLAEQKREAERLFMETLIQNASIGIAVLDRDGYVLMSNPAYANIPTLTEPAIPGACIYEIVPADGVEAVGQMLEGAIERGEIARVRSFRSQSAGMEKPSYWDVDYVPLPGGNGDVSSVLALSYDVTDLVEARHAVEGLAADTSRSLKQLQAVLENINQGLLIVEPDGTISMINRAAQEMLGADHPAPATLDELRSIAAVHSLSGEPLDLEQLPSERVLRGERFSEVELRIRSRVTDEEFIFSVGGAPVRDAHGDLMLGIVTFSDITERFEIQDRLRRLNEELEEQVAERTRVAETRAVLLQSMAGDLLNAEQRERRRLSALLHDHLQQLLAASQMRAHLLGSQVADDDVRAMLDELAELLGEAVAASRSLATELSPPVLARGLAAATRWLADHMLDTHKLQVDIEVAGDVEPKSEELSAFLLQAMRELLFNVVKHAEVKIAAVRVCRQDDRIVVEVRDDGRGFDPSQLGDSQEQHGPGTGLLAIRRRLELLGGSFEIASRPGEGATFQISLETEPAVGTKPRPEAKQIPLRLPTEQAEGELRVLVVDDHDIVREGLVALISESSQMAVVGEACDGVTAVAMAADLRPHVVVMDVSMPGMDGIEATRQIVEQQPNIRVVALSMHAEQDVTRKMREAGADSYVTKGGPTSDLIDAIRGAPRSKD